MRKINSLLLLVLFTILSEQMVVAENSVVKRQKYVYSDTVIADFDCVSILNPINVVYTQSKTDAGKVRIYAPKGDKIVSITSKNGELSIRYGKGYKNSFGVIMVYVSSKELKKVNCSMGGNFTTSGAVSGKSLKLKVAGNSQIRCNNLVYEDIKAKRGIGRGDILVGGKVTNATYSIIGGGEVDADELIADTVKCKIFGSGDIGCHVNSDITVRSIGRGAAYCKGNLKISGKNNKIRVMPEKVEE